MEYKQKDIGNLTNQFVSNLFATIEKSNPALSAKITQLKNFDFNQPEKLEEFMISNKMGTKEEIQAAMENQNYLEKLKMVKDLFNAG